jgi:hypothetical protein
MKESSEKKSSILRDPERTPATPPRLGYARVSVNPFGES